MQQLGDGRADDSTDTVTDTVFSMQEPRKNKTIVANACKALLNANVAARHTVNNRC
jgi:hypothetical protein